jgi:hypothetical protein
MIMAKLNYKKGLLRIWVVLTVCWEAILTGLLFEEIYWNKYLTWSGVDIPFTATLMIGPPIVVLVTVWILFFSFGWIKAGFIQK